MKRIGAIRAAGWGLALIVTVIAVAASLAGNFEVAIAALAALIGAGLAVGVDTWHRTRFTARTVASITRAIERLSHSIHEEQAAASKATLKAITNERRYQTTQIEAMLQVLPRLSNARLLPPTGGYAMGARALAEIVDLIEMRRPRLVVELGSGTSTVWIASLLAGTGGRLVSIDHDSSYGTATQAELRRHDLGGVAEVRIAPLVERAPDRRWYDTAALADLDDIDVLIVDGPPANTCQNAREPALEELFEALSPGAVVVLDDIGRDQEQAVLAAWLERWPEFTRIDAGASTLAVISRDRD